MLWVGMFLNTLLSYLQRASALRFVLNTAAALAVVLVANVLRNAMLFVKEAGILALPQWMHAGVGLAAFMAIALAIAALVRWKRPVQEVARAGPANGPLLSEEGCPRALTLPPPASGRGTCSSVGRGGPTECSPVPTFSCFGITRATSLTFLALLLLAALAPLMRSASPALAAQSEQEPVWPSTFQGRPLERVPLTAVDRRFAAQFPGHIARFTDGSRQLIVRAIEQPTRLLHPAADCFKGLGYSVERRRVVDDADGTRWVCFAAEKSGRSLEVCERIYDPEGSSWTDASSWYWAAILGRTRGPWLALTVATAQ
jgi:exosortase/archaeosortase family protein